MPAIDQHHELDGSRPAEVDERVERGPDRPAGVEDVVHEQDALVVDRKGNLRLADERLRADGRAHEVVAIERDVERAGRHLVTGNLVNGVRNPARQRHAARADADEGDLFEAAVAFEDFVRDSREAAGHPVRIENDRHHHLFAASPGRVKERRTIIAYRQDGRTGRTGRGESSGESEKTGPPLQPIPPVLPVLPVLPVPPTICRMSE